MKIELKNFEIPDIDSWKNQVLKESKNQNVLHYINEVENLNIDLSDKDNKYTFHTAFNTGKRNDWDILSYHMISNSFQNNEKLLQSLEHGSNHLYLDITNSNPSWTQIFENIKLEYIHVSIKFHNNQQIDSFKAFLSKEIEHLFTIVISFSIK